MPIRRPSNAALHDGVGMASFAIIMSLINKLVATKRLSSQSACEILDDALLDLEKHQAVSVSPEVIQVARGVIELALGVLEAKPDRRGKRPRGRP